jgi:hypothetical protein
MKPGQEPDPAPPEAPEGELILRLNSGKCDSPRD